MQKKTMQRWLRCGLAVLLAFIIIMSSVAPLFADTLDELEQKMQEYEQEIANLAAEQGLTEERIAELTAHIAEVMEEITVLDNQINACVSNIAMLEVNISNNEQLMKQLQTELVNAKETEAEYMGAMKERIRMMYEYGDVNYLELLLGSKSISDFFSRIEYVSQMASYDEKIQKGLEETRKRIQEMEGVLEETELQLNLDCKRLENEKNNLENTRADKQSLYDELEKNRESALIYSQFLLSKKIEMQKEWQSAANEYDAEVERQAQQNQNGSEEESSEEESSEEESSEEESFEEEEEDTDSGYTGTGSFIWPVPSSYYISSPYGWRLHPIYGYERLYAGTDIGADYWADIVAADSGYVYYVGYDDGGYGNYVMIDHGNGYMILYAHCNSILVYSGQYVSQGETIALVGSTGPHCHFEVWYCWSTTDPMDYFS